MAMAMGMGMPMGMSMVMVIMMEMGNFKEIMFLLYVLRIRPNCLLAIDCIIECGVEMFINFIM